jgi:hypothetical protein
MANDSNKPCYCGSGKKYKACCRISDLDKMRSNVLPFQAKPHDGAVSKAIKWLEERHPTAWRNAFGNLHQEVLSPEDLNKMARLDAQTLGAIEINFTEFLLAQGEIEINGDSVRICDYLIGPSGPTLTQGQRDWLQQLGQRSLRLYVATEVVKGQEMTLCDVLDAEAPPITVLERSGSQNLSPGTYLGCRVMRVGQHFELSGATYGFSILAGESVIQALKHVADEITDISERVQEQSLVLIEDWLQQYIAPPRMPEIFDKSSGEQMLMITDQYRVLDRAKLESLLTNCADLEGNPNQGWSRSKQWPDGQTRPNIQINPDFAANVVKVFYVIQSHADAGRPWFEHLAQSSVSFCQREIVNPTALLSQADPITPPLNAKKTINTKAAAKKSSAKKPQLPNNSFSAMQLSAEDNLALAQAMTDVIRRTYINWSDEPIPLLDNKSPRQASQTRAGLERVKGLLRSYEADERRQATDQGRPEISFAFLWDALGLERDHLKN